MPIKMHQTYLLENARQHIPVPKQPAMQQQLRIYQSVAVQKNIAKFLIIYHNRSYGILNRF